MAFLTSNTKNPVTAVSRSTLFSLIYDDERRLVKLCNFEIMEDQLMRDRIICGIRDEKTRTTLLKKKKLDLAATINICRIAESSSSHLRAMSITDNVQTIQNATVYSRTAAVTILDADLTAKLADADAVASNMLLARRPVQRSVSSARIVASQITSHQSACLNDEHTALEWSTSSTKLMTTSKRYSL